MNMKEKEIKDLAINFLICCYFGQSENLGRVAVDRAYIDMASHTLKFNDEFKDERWKCRYNASVVLLDGLKNCNKDFKEWHSSMVNALKMEYNGKLLTDNKTLTEGQAQKWINMSIKYLYVFSVVLGKNDERLKDFTELLSISVENYNMPIDSYILKEKGYKNISWSKLNENEYKKIISEIEGANKFIWELEHWEEASQKHKEFNKDSYERYIQDNDLDEYKKKMD
ncbi:hypothetical protein SAMN02745111_00704 [Eubacterium uniforme]|uniref:Uncharacterized protein n=2 Tax=Eubacterium uniforme TaxID=39495 RepID=A0A1T4VCX8_9FIRM|nr:hypothetical protein SAMN02745111_00704 [Eubacterium uniforme]